MDQSFKNFKTYFVLLVSSLTLLGVAYFYFSSTRFYISNSANNRSYKIDRWTGETWLLLYDEQIKIKDPLENSANSDSTKAINLAKGSYNLSNTNVVYNSTNESAIYSILNNLRGDLNIIGWSSKKITDQTYLVSYKYRHNGNLKSYNFDVNLNESIVRYVNDDPILLNKYQNYIQNYSSLKLLYDNLKNNNKITGIPDFELFKKTLLENSSARRELYNRIKEVDFLLVPPDFTTFNEMYFTN